MKETLIVNLVGGPGAGKSTTALGLAYMMKRDGVLAEYVPEYAKKLTWIEDFDTLSRQLYVAGKQYRAVHVPLGKVDVIVTDSPFIISLLYPDHHSGDQLFEDWLVKVFNTFNNLTIFLERNPSAHKYQSEGRTQTEDESAAIDQDCRQLLDRHQIPYTAVQVGVGDTTVLAIMEMIKERIK